jgi:uncharacterized protein
MRHSTERRAPRPVRPAAAALSKMLSRAWSLPAQRNFVALERNVQVPMSDGAVLLADHYLPITSQPAATVLVRTPYGRGLPFSLLDAQLIAERGFHVLLQSCRGTFGSGGQFEPMGQEISDGRDTVAWLRGQSWFDGRLATFGASYLGFVQWALALDPPPELIAAVVYVGPPGARDLLGTEAPWFDTWLEHPDLTDPFWAPLQCGAALERISVPTLLVGGWQDLFLEQTLEQYRALAARGVPTRLIMGPWTHLDAATRAGPAFAESLAWLERYAGQDPDDPKPGHTARIWVGGAREWREVTEWPPAGQAPQRWSLGPDGTLTWREPAAGTAVPPASFRYDPADPTPSVGGATLSLNAGVRDNRPVEQRPDVLVFSSELLDEPVEVIGDVTADLHVTRDNPNADLFVRLCDVDLRGRSRNVCDGIVRLTDADPLAGTVRVSLIGAAHRFGRGHRLRLQVAGGAHPRFTRNPGNGQITAPAKDFLMTRYDIGLSAADPSALLLSAVSQTAGKAAAHA